MEICSSTSSLSSVASLSSLSLASSTSSFELVHTWTPYRPPPKSSAPKPKTPPVEFWYEDDGEEPVPVTEEKFSSTFLEDCCLCKRRLGAGRDVYMCAGEAAFCSEECRQDWMEIRDVSSGEKIRRRSAAIVKPFYSSRIPAAEMYGPARYRADGAVVAV